MTDGRGGLQTADVPEPIAPEGGARVRVLACGFCGSDLSKLDDPGTRRRAECSGTRSWACWSDPEPSRPGLRWPTTCPAVTVRSVCSGHSSLCAQFVRHDLDPGGFAEALVVDHLHLADSVFPLPDSVDDVTGTLLEPLSCVLRALDVAAGLTGVYPLPAVGAAARAPPPATPAGAGGRLRFVGLLFLTLLAHASSPVAPSGLLFLEQRPPAGGPGGIDGRGPGGVGCVARRPAPIWPPPSARRRVPRPISAS